MFTLLKVLYEKIVGVCVFLTVIGVAIEGAIFGYSLAYYSWDLDFPFIIIIVIVGFIVGLFLGVLVSVMLFGSLALIFHISNRLDDISKSLSEFQNTSVNYQNNAREYFRLNSRIKDSEEQKPVSDIWVCQHCGATNLHEYKFCINCGK
ncbi:MAG: zinc ribbon domain-containing protein [Treponema sp.]|nr:zinc ribbon domain-containing protein [Treponema sp.]